MPLSQNVSAGHEVLQIRFVALLFQQYTVESIYIYFLLPELVGASKWLVSPQAQFFGVTLLPNLAIVDSVGVAIGSWWEKYLELRLQGIDLEASLAEEWLLTKLLSALRAENLRSDLTQKRSVIVRHTQA